MADNNVSYLNKTFSDFKISLINYAKTYFPTVYNDFSEANPGNMFIEMASYVGDVMSFYLDTQVQETLLLYAKEKSNLYALSYMLGYRPKVSYAATTIVDIYQLCPGFTSGGDFKPNVASFGVIVPENTSLNSTNGTKFLTINKVDFTDLNNTEVTLTENNLFLLKKSTRVISAEIKTTTIPFSSPQKFANAIINDAGILQILDITDTQGNKWYEVPYLAQSAVFDKVDNPNYSSDGVPYLLQLRRVPRRFVSRFLSDDTLQLEFGAGTSNKSDNVILPNPDNIRLGLVPGISTLYDDFNKATPFFTQEYGLAPSSDLTIRYLVGGGLESNVDANTINTIDKANLAGTSDIPTKDSVIVNNPVLASGGRSGDQIEEIRNSALNAYQSQLRAVTKEDYMTRALSLPPDYGSIAKVYVTQDMAGNILTTPTVTTTKSQSLLSLDMYVLGYTSDKKLTTAETTLKQNLATYINEFRMVTDAINIKDAFYINIGVNFDITTKSGFSNTDVIINCISILKEYFSIEKWNINQPINLSDVVGQLLQVKGVQSVPKLEIVNKQDSTGVLYSQYAYDISGATRNGNIYPSLDPSIFEVRYPDQDIQGRVVPFTI